MSKVIFISPYLKGGSNARRSNLVHYVATREGVEVLTNDVRKMPPTKKQQNFIRRLIRDFPAAKEMLEYEDYMALPNRETAWELINQMYEQFVEPLDKKENFIDYVANRPGAQPLGEHGLWCSTGKVPVLTSVMREVADHQGNVWTPVVSLRREDAVRLGYLIASAKQGNQYAQYTLGKMLLLGKDLERDEDLAVYLLTLSADQGNPYAKYFLDHKDQMRHGVSAHVAAMRMMHHMGNIFRDNTAKGGAYTNLTQIDKKRRKALQRKRLAAGHKAKDHEEQAPSQQTM